MITWWNDLTVVQQIFALIAIPSTLIMLIQAILLLIGAGGSEGADMDGDGIPDSADLDGDSGLALFSVRGIVSMLAVMGWSAMALLESLVPWLAILLAAGLGILTLFGMALLMRAISRLQSSGNINVGNAVGKIAEVYIPIPPAGKGTGKVTMTLQEKYCELTAITASTEKLKTGTFVRVVSVDGAGILMVEPIVREGDGKNED